MSRIQETPKIQLPRGWKQHVRSFVLHVISLAQYATVYTRSWAADSTNNRRRFRALRVRFGVTLSGTVAEITTSA